VANSETAAGALLPRVEQRVWRALNQRSSARNHVISCARLDSAAAALRPPCTVTVLLE